MRETQNPERRLVCSYSLRLARRWNPMHTLGAPSSRPEHGAAPSPWQAPSCWEQPPERWHQSLFQRSNWPWRPYDGEGWWPFSSAWLGGPGKAAPSSCSLPARPCAFPLGNIRVPNGAYPVSRRALMPSPIAALFAESFDFCGGCLRARACVSQTRRPLSDLGPRRQ